MIYSLQAAHSPTSYLSHMDLPLAFEQAMRAQLGDAFDAFRTTLTEPSPTSVRHHPAKCETTPRKGRPVPWADLGEYLAERPVFTLDPLYHAGCYYVQEASSMILEAFMAALPPTSEPRSFLDLCAAPGGKATHLLSLMKETDYLMANEIHPHRHGVLFENLTRWGDARVIVGRCTPDELAGRHPSRFDVLLVDAPCSGEGMIRKDEVALQQWSEELVRKCALRQQAILQQAMALLRPGGHLIYSTCTFNRAENEAQIQQVMQDHDCTEIIPDLEESWGIVRSDHGVRCYPHRLAGEGLYMCMIRKNSGEGAPATLRASGRYGNRHLGHSAAAPDILEPYIHTHDFDWYKGRQENWRAIPTSLQQSASDLIHSPLDVQSGLLVGKMKTPTVFIPDHALALSTSRHADIPRMELEREDALRFLKKETIPAPDLPKGIYLVTYQGNGLGWAKVIPGRVNNLIPHHWRIRMSLTE